MAISRPSTAATKTARAYDRSNGGAGREARRRARGRRASATAPSLSQRIVWAFLFVAVGYLGLAGRLAYIQVYEHAHYRQMAQALRERRRTVPARRGVILDRNETLLVNNERAADVVLDPNAWYAGRPEPDKKRRQALARAARPVFVRAGLLLPGRGYEARAIAAAERADARAVAQARQQTALNGLTTLLPDLDRGALLAKLGARSASGRLRTVDVRRQVDAQTASRIKQANLPGVGVLPTTRRVALKGSLAPHLVGYTGIDGDGLEGLERELDPILRGSDGLLQAEFDRRGRTIPGTVRRDEAMKPGHDVLLTIDANLQHVVQEALRKVFVNSRAEAASAVVLHPRTGDVLALANFPDYDVNRRGDFPASSRGNRAVISVFEPGSTLKLVTLAAGLQEKRIAPDSTFFCSGARTIGRRTIHCAHGAKHGSETLTEVLSDSCNLASAEIAARLGKQTLWSYEKAFGLGERTRSGLPGEIPGLLARPGDWSDIQLANIGFGQGIAVTPLQLAAAYAAIANDGVWMRPRIVRGTRSPGVAGGPPVVREIAPERGRRVVSPEVAGVMRKMLQAVIDVGTGKSAALDGYSAGGKTGTAQVAENGRYGGKYVASFIGMAPANKPRFVVLVAVTDPKNGYYGGVVAGPVFREIAQKALIASRTPCDRPTAAALAAAKKRARRQPAD